MSATQLVTIEEAFPLALSHSGKKSVGQIYSTHTASTEKSDSPQIEDNVFEYASLKEQTKLANISANGCCSCFSGLFQRDINFQCILYKCFTFTVIDHKITNFLEVGSVSILLQYYKQN